ncbi:hypothetical protein TWF718_008450 [Orbilia javanica]|uniref:Copper transport protein n=1 Tax=Orbilia javanica TaxID=47235 RepID=A0AAN8RHP5_9PEZI
MNHTAEDQGEMDHSHHHHHHHNHEMNHTGATTMDHSAMDHSTMDHSSHAGHNHAGMMHGDGAMCKMDMYWNWYTIDACFLSKSWHITSAGMFASSCIGIVFLVVLVEALRRCAREWDRHIVRDWKKRAAMAAEGVDVSIVDKSGVEDTPTATTTTPTAAAAGCCSTAQSSSSSSEKGDLVTKPSAQTLTTTKKSVLSRFCPFTTSKAVNTPRPTIVQHLLKSLIYAVLLGVGYILMLLAMYYNGYIFFCLVIGAWLGNFLFGMDTCVLDESVVGAERGCGC